VTRDRGRSTSVPSRRDGGDVKSILCRLIEENAGIPAREVRDDSAIDGDLAMDSMSFLSLQVAVEETFGITCAPEEIETARRFDAIAKLITERVAAAPPTRTRSKAPRPTARRRT
jgi:acyl carrier protein